MLQFEFKYLLTVLEFILFTGLIDVVMTNGHKKNIEVFEPGCYETYKLLPSGKVEFKTKKRFHKIGNPPLYKTLVNITGMGCGIEWIYLFVCWV